MKPIRREKKNKVEKEDVPAVEPTKKGARKTPAVTQKKEAKKEAPKKANKKATSRKLDEDYHEAGSHWHTEEDDDDDFEDLEDEEDEDDNANDDDFAVSDEDDDEPTLRRNKQGDFIDDSNLFTEDNIFDAGKWRKFLGNADNVATLRVTLQEMFSTAALQNPPPSESARNRRAAEVTQAITMFTNLASTFVGVKNIHQVAPFMNVVHSTCKRTRFLLGLARRENLQVFHEAEKKRPSWMREAQKAVHFDLIKKKLLREGGSRAGDDDEYDTFRKSNARKATHGRFSKFSRQKKGNGRAKAGHPKRK